MKPWFSKLIVWLDVDIPVGLIINFLLVYPLPPLIILISDIVFLFELVLNLWIPELLYVLNPTVLIPAE